MRQGEGSSDIATFRKRMAMSRCHNDELSTFAGRKPKLTKAEMIAIGAAEWRHLAVKIL
jgi:hypothetical protein